MEKKISVSKIPGSLNLKFTFQFDYSSMPKFWVNLWLQLNTIGFPLIVTLWLLITTLWGKVTCDNFPRNKSKLSHHIQLHEKWYRTSIEQKY